MISNYGNLMAAKLSHHLTELHHEKICFGGFRPDPTKTRLYSHRRWLKACNFGFRKERDYGTIYVAKKGTNLRLHFLALSRRLIGELIGYSWSGVRPSASSVRPSFTMLKDLLLRNCWADQSQILCGASLGRGNDILFAASWSHDQDGRHAHIW